MKNSKEPVTPFKKRQKLQHDLIYHPLKWIFLTIWAWCCGITFPYYELQEELQSFIFPGTFSIQHYLQSVEEPNESIEIAQIHYHEQLSCAPINVMFIFGKASAI